jgi:hypothetical protein
MWVSAREELGQPTKLTSLVALSDGWEDLPHCREAIGSNIVDAAKEVLIDG